MVDNKKLYVRFENKILGNAQMDFNQQNLKKALKELNKKYRDLKGNNKKSIGGSTTKNIKDKKYKKLSMKRSRFQNLNYKFCNFENIAFTASSFHNVTFKNTELIGNSFACCNFFDSQVLANTKSSCKYSGNNFSQSNFTSCNFTNAIFTSSGFLQSLFYNCKLCSVDFQSTTLEGSCFNNCLFDTVNAGHTNVEFIELLNTKFKNVIFPFYQFAYIIGASDLLKSISKEISFEVAYKDIPYKEYISQIDNLILYYWDKQEYFPVCNLLIAKEDVDAAQSAFLNGINLALENLDFRMIRHFCRLAKRHDLLDEVTVCRARKEIENYLFDDTIPPERINDFIINAGEINKILLSGKSDSIIYNFNIRTNINKTNKIGVKYINALSNELNNALSQYDFGQLGFQVAVSNHSPFEIAVDVICATGALATIAQLIWSIVEKSQYNTQSNKTSIPDNYSRADQMLYAKYIDNRIELCKEQLLNIKLKYSERKMNKYIEEITQQLKTDIKEMYSKDIMIFKKNNSGEN